MKFVQFIIHLFMVLFVLLWRQFSTPTLFTKTLCYCHILARVPMFFHPSWVNFREIQWAWPSVACEGNPRVLKENCCNSVWKCKGKLLLSVSVGGPIQPVIRPEAHSWKFSQQILIISEAITIRTTLNDVPKSWGILMQYC